MQNVIAKCFHHRSPHGVPRKRKHLGQAIVGEPDRQISVGYEYAFDHAAKDGAQAEVFVRDQLGKFLLTMSDLMEIIVDLPNNRWPGAG
jgi:hypothetical protein